MIDCPSCGEPIAENAVICPACKWEPDRKTKGTTKAKEPSEASIRAVESRRRFEANSPTAEDLTPQQWYNVCKFFPRIAEHCQRQRPLVGPDHPLDKTSQLGPMLRGFRVRKPVPRDPEAEAERAAIQSEAA